MISSTSINHLVSLLCKCKIELRTFLYVEIPQIPVTRAELRISYGAAYAQLDGIATHALIIFIGIKNKSIGEISPLWLK